MRTELLPGHTYSSTEVAWLVFGKLGRQVDWFYRNRARLQRQEGFPPPVSKFGWPRWSGKALLDWMARPQHQRQAAGAGVVDLTEILRRRAQDLYKQA